MFMSNIIHLNRYRKTEDGRTPLVVSHLDGTVKGSPRQETESFDDRMTRIRRSLDAINTLMAELKARKAYD
jgi:hypothetical protein